MPEGMVLIFGGEFEMGSNNTPTEQPVHTVYLDAFYIDQYEVTNAQYKAFVLANPEWQKGRIDNSQRNNAPQKLLNTIIFAHYLQFLRVSIENANVNCYLTFNK